MSEGNVEELDAYRALEEIIKRDYDTDKFAFAMFLDDGHFGTYVSDSMTDMELCYLIKLLEERRLQMFGEF